MELIFTLPILMILLLAILEFSILFLSREHVVEASRAGARAATMPGATAEIVESEVRRVLPVVMQSGMVVDYLPGLHSGDLVTVSVQVRMEQTAPDLLWPIGYSLEGDWVIAATRMIKE